jgi:hypothetical protein
MRVHARSAELGLLPAEIAVTTASRERFRRRVATTVAALTAFIAVLVASAISVALGLYT